MSDKTWVKILGFKGFEKGWRHNEEVAFEDREIEKALGLTSYARLLGFFATNAFRDPPGGITVTVCYEDHYAEFTCEANDTVTFREQCSDEDVRDKQGLSIDQAKAILKECWSKWNAES